MRRCWQNILGNKAHLNIIYIVILKTLSKRLPGALVGIQLACFLLYFPFSFNYSIDQMDQYYIILFGVILFLLQAAVILFSIRSGYFKAALVYTICCLLLLLLLFSEKYSFANQHFTVCISIVITTIPLFLCSSRDLLKFVWGCIIVFYLVELLWGLKQCIYGQPIMGSLRNSGIYSCYLVVHLPVLYFFYASYIKMRMKRPLQHLIISSFLVSLSLLICLNRSRSAIVAFLLINLFYFRRTLFIPIQGYYRSGAKARAICVVSGILLLLAAAGLCEYLFLIKRASANGRLLIWQVALSHLPDYWLGGTGFGRASSLYPVWQAQYFAGNPLPSNGFFLSADDTFIFYNDLLQLLVEIGVLSFIVLGTLIAFFFTSLIKEAPANRPLTGVLAGILVCSLTSYPLHVPYFLFILIFTFISFPSIHPIRWGQGIAKPAPLITFCVMLPIGVIALASSFQKARAVYLITTAAGSGAQSSKDKLERVRRQLPALHKDGKYLVRLGAAFMENNDLTDAIYYLGEGKRLFTGYQSVFLLANAYERSNKVEESMAAYRFLSDYIPARFAPKYELFNLYLIRNDTASAIKMAQDILSMPVKIESFRVDEIKNDVGMKYREITKK